MHGPAMGSMAPQKVAELGEGDGFPIDTAPRARRLGPASAAMSVPAWWRVRWLSPAALEPSPGRHDRTAPRVCHALLAPFQVSLPGSPGAGIVNLRHSTSPVAASSAAIQSRTPLSPPEAPCPPASPQARWRVLWREALPCPSHGANHGDFFSIFNRLVYRANGGPT